MELDAASSRMCISPACFTLKDRLGFLLKDSLLYGTSISANKLLSLISFPLLTRHFSTEQYGIIDALLVLTNLFTLLAVFGQDSAIARFFYEYRDTESRRQMISQSFFIQIAMVVVLTPFLWSMSDNLASLYTGKRGISDLCRLMIIQTPFTLMITFSQNLLKWTLSRIRFIIMSVASTTTSVLLIAFCLLTLKTDIHGLFVAQLCNQILFGALGMFFCRKWLELPHHSLNHLRPLLSYGSPFGVICVFAACMPAIDRFFIGHYLTAESLGLYAVGYKTAFLMSLPLQAFQTAWGPFSLAIHKEEDSSATYNHVLVYFSIFTSLSILLLSFSAEFIISLLASSRYLPASCLVLPLALALGAQSIGWVASIGIELSRKSHLNFPCVALSIFMTMGAIYILIEPLGIRGVAWGVCVGYLTKGLAQVYLAYRSYPLRFRLGKTLALFFSTVLAGLIGTSLEFGNPFHLTIRIITLLLVVSFSWSIILTRKERSILLQFLRFQRL